MSDTEGTTQFECRTCLRIITNDVGFHEIFQLWSSPWNPRRKSTIAADLNKLADVTIQESDKHSKVICQACCIKLFNACQYIVNTKKSDQILKQRQVQDNTETPVSFEGKLWPRPIEVDKNLNSDVFGDVEIKQEVLSDDEDYSDDVESDSRPSMDIKIEPEEMTGPPLKIVINGAVSITKKGNYSSINGCETYQNVEYLDSTVKEEPLSEDELDLPLECMLCSKSFNSMSGLKAHVIAHHSYKSVRRKPANSSPERVDVNRFVCGTCRRSFVTRTDLMVHETCHNKWVCYGCSRNFDSFGLLSKHRRFCKAAQLTDTSKPKLLEDVIRPLPEITIQHILANKKEDEPLQETLQCTMCSEKFSDSYYMKIHHEIHHSMEAKDDEAQSNVAELSKESQDLETKALQNMFEQVNEETKAKSKVKIEVEISLNEEANIEQNNAEETDKGTESDMQMETDILPVIFDCNTVENDTRKTENQTEETEITQKEVGDESHTQIVEEASISQVDENQPITDANDKSDSNVNVNEDIVSDENDKNNEDENDKNNEKNTNNVQIDDNIDETVSDNDNNQIQVPTVQDLSENTETVTSEITYESTFDEKALESSVNDEKSIDESVVDDENNQSYQIIVENEKEIEEVGSYVKDNTENNEIADSLPTLEVSGNDDMEIDSEI